MELHFLAGYGILALLLFRVAWGFVGSDTARFSRFLRSPPVALRHLAHLYEREPDTAIGHNAAGGWMVLLMLALLCGQVATGLCANDDVDTEGPLFNRVGKSWSDYLSHIHAVNFRYIEIAVVLHLAAILIYTVVKRHDLLWPMITGRKKLPTGVTPPLLASPMRAFVVFAIAVAVVGIFVNSL